MPTLLQSQLIPPSVPMSWGRVNLEAEQTMLNGKRQRDTDDVGFGNGGFPIQAMSNGGAVRLGMKRMKSSFDSTSPPIHQPPQLIPNLHHPTSTPHNFQQYQTLYPGFSQNLYSKADQDTGGTDMDFLTRTENIRLNSPVFPLVQGVQQEISHNDMDMESLPASTNMVPGQILPTAPPPSLFSTSSYSQDQISTFSAPSMISHPTHHPPRPVTPNPPADGSSSRGIIESPSLSQPYVEPYWREGSSSRNYQKQEFDPVEQIQGIGMQRNRSGMGTGLGDLGRSVAVAMGMGGDSRMGMGMDDVEMDNSPPNLAPHIPKPLFLPPNFDPPTVPLNSPATTPTRSHAIPNLLMSRYSMGPRGDCEKCRRREPGHVAHWG